MKFSICNDTYADRSCLEAATHAAECGYEGLELAPSTIWNDPSKTTLQEAQALARGIQKLDLEVIGFHWLLTGTDGMHLTHPDKSLQAKLIDYVTHLAQLCSTMGGKVMVWGSPAMRNLESEWDKEEAEKRAVEALHTISTNIESLDVTLALEPLAKWETNYWTTADSTWETIQKVNHPNCRLHLDCKAMADESTPPEEIIKTHKDHFVHFHANDPNLLGPGMGDMDLRGVGQTLRDINYNGWVSVETFKPGPGYEVIAEESLKFMKENFK